MKIGKNIKAIRVSRQMEQKELASKLHISNKTISSWECDRTEPNIGMFEKIAEALNVTKTELLEGIHKTPDTIVVSNGKVIKNATNLQKSLKNVKNIALTSEEKYIIKLYRSGKYKEIARLMMEKM